MHLVFVHQGFPAQFHAIAAALMASGHQVHAIGSDTGVGLPDAWPQLADCIQHRYPAPRAEELSTAGHPSFQACLLGGERVAPAGAN